MNKEPANGVKDKIEETATVATAPWDGEAKAPVQAASKEDLIKELEKIKEGQGEEDVVGTTIAELLHMRQIASVYIKTEFTGPVWGPVHTGSGDIPYPYVGTQSEGMTVGVGHILDEALKKIRKVYMVSSTYTQAQKVLNQKKVLILWGHAHWGKWTTALHLLLSLHSEKIIEINPDVDLMEMRSSDFEPERGHVIDTLAPESARKLNTFILHRLSGHMRELGNHLVITVDGRVSLSKEALSEHLVLWNQVPDRVQLLEKHLAWYLTDKRLFVHACKLIDADTVQQLLSTHLLPREIDRLAELLTRVAHGELELEEALARFEARAQQQVAEWFEAHTDLEERTFMISLAVLNGASYRAAVEADERLQSLIKPPPGEDKTQVHQSVFGSTRSQRVKKSCAHLAQGYAEAEFGRSPVEIIVLDNPSFQPAVLHYAWHTYDRLRRPLLIWLRDLGFHSSFDVRARVAAAVGELSKYDFVHILREILLPWANHLNSRARAAAALALGIPAWEGEFAPQVLGLLHHWSSLGNNWRLCWTAASAYGELVGLRFPDAALQNLYVIAKTEDVRLFGVLSRSIISLFQAGHVVSDYYLKVLDTLVAWTDDPKAEVVTLTGLFIFLNLALEANVKAAPEEGEWPALLWLVREGEVHRKKVLSLWRLALNSKLARESALEALHQWLLAADEDNRLYPSIEQLIMMLMDQGTGREQERLRFYLDRWASHSKKETTSAAKVLLVLNSK